MKRKMKNSIKSYWTFGDDGWRIESRPTNENKSHLILYAENEIIFEGSYGDLIRALKKEQTK